MKVTMDMQEYETLRDTQIPYTIEETETKKVVHVSKNIIEQVLAERFDIEDVKETPIDTVSYRITKIKKEFDVVFDD